LFLVRFGIDGGGDPAAVLAAAARALILERIACRGFCLCRAPLLRRDTAIDECRYYEGHCGEPQCSVNCVAHMILPSDPGLRSPIIHDSPSESATTIMKRVFRDGNIRQ